MEKTAQSKIANIQREGNVRRSRETTGLPSNCAESLWVEPRKSKEISTPKHSLLSDPIWSKHRGEKEGKGVKIQNGEGIWFGDIQKFRRRTGRQTRSGAPEILEEGVERLRAYVAWELGCGASSHRAGCLEKGVSLTLSK